MNDDDLKYRTGVSMLDKFFPRFEGAKRPSGYTKIPFRRPHISARLKFWLGIGKTTGSAPDNISCMCEFQDILFIAAGSVIFRLDKVRGEMVIVPFHESVCNKCKGGLL